jgi:phosphatidylserine/phosphatidylglycerophosphate/cardiolipin synthase-like enzyme
MRKKVAQQGLSVQAIAGTYVVLLGFNMKQADCDGLLGFAIHRTDHTEEEAYWLKGQKTFTETDPGFPSGSQYPTRKHPIQGFTWSDYTAKPGHDYTYRVLAMKGTPTALRPVAEASVQIQTESPEGGTHDIFFNRGAGASQEYARRFGNRPPSEVGQAAYDWLSRGLYESMIHFIEQASGPDFELRVCAYEFHYLPVLQALRAAERRGARLRIIYDRRQDNPGQMNDDAVRAAEISAACTKRTANPSAISHNKFIVLLKNGKPRAVLTGGTNFSEGGIFGHSNAVHIVEEPEIAGLYARYWDLLSADPVFAALRPDVSALYDIPDGKPPEGTGSVFSPRSKLEALDWYARLAAGAQSGLFMTFAFGMDSRFQDAYRTSQARMRFALLEKPTRPMKAGPARDAEEEKIRALRRLPENRFAIGAYLKMNKFDNWLTERISGLNHNVQYLHTKYMLIDPLEADPIVVAGSANFSEASSNKNDENMVIVRGNTRVADIYLGEFMRLYSHYAFREWASSQPANAPKSLLHLRTDDWWKDYFGETARSRQREYFAGDTTS